MLVVIENYVWATAEERLASALWALHTYHFRRFSHTLRLLSISPIEDCGKTTLLNVVGQFAHRMKIYGDVTAAAIYRQLEDDPDTAFGIDEADNLDLSKDRKMRQLFNKGYETHGANPTFPTRRKK